MTYELGVIRKVCTGAAVVFAAALALVILSAGWSRFTAHGEQHCTVRLYPDHSWAVDIARPTTNLGGCDLVYVSR